MPDAVRKVITLDNFCDYRLRGFGVARGRSLAFSIDLLRRFYNTFALPYEECSTIGMCVSRVKRSIRDSVEVKR